MKVRLDDGACIYDRAHDTDAGIDLCTPVNVFVPRRGSVVIDTGVHVQLPHNTVGMIKSKSGLNCKKSIVSEGVIDEGYTGSIKVKLYNHSDKDVEFLHGDKISQLVIIPVVYESIEIVDRIEGGDRGENGFGSTGK